MKAMLFQAKQIPKIGFFDFIQFSDLKQIGMRMVG
jgi:hypothetical protein